MTYCDHLARFSVPAMIAGRLRRIRGTTQQRSASFSRVSRGSCGWSMSNKAKRICWRSAGVNSLERAAETAIALAAQRAVLSAGGRYREA